MSVEILTVSKVKADYGDDVDGDNVKDMDDRSRLDEHYMVTACAVWLKPAGTRWRAGAVRAS